ncbi:MAG: hypothetical protein QXW00_03595 [Candidatus Woesearchaeota archaeon]
MCALLTASLLILIFGCSERIVRVEERDRCGVVGGMLFHTIKDEDACRQVCYSDCLGRKLILKDVEFAYNVSEGCNSCVCLCK